MSFGTMNLDMKPTRMTNTVVKVGIVNVRDPPSPEAVDALVSWILLERIDMVTGFFGSFGNAKNWVQDFAARTVAISFTPLYQVLKSQGRNMVHPSHWLFFGYYRSITVPPDSTAVADKEFVLGLDIWNEMLEANETPEWTYSDYGSAFVRNASKIKMQPIDRFKWISGCYQTCVWLGSATPSKSSQTKWLLWKGKGKGGKGKGK